MHCAAFSFARSVLFAVPVGAVFLGALPAQAEPTYEVLHVFRYPEAGNPDRQLIQGVDGNFYGTFRQGGAGHGGGLFRITPDGNYSVVHAFDFTEGFLPVGVSQGPDGDLYGVTLFGSDHDGGALYRVSTNGQRFELLHVFTGGRKDGFRPYGVPVFSSDGALYAVTALGGRNDDGLVYRRTPDGTMTILHEFDRASDGYSGYSPTGLALAADGSLYGSNYESGLSARCTFIDGCGGVFHISTDGKTFRGRLLTEDEGWLPPGPPAIGADGALVGVSSNGGEPGCEYPSCGTVWRAFPATGRIQVIHRFRSWNSPNDAPILASDGKLYGSVMYGGECNCGAVYSIDPAGNFEIVHAFRPKDGTLPMASPIQGSDGNLYGVASQGGGQGGWGTVYRISGLAK
jgi:uncharacterized repeat protein (TIGR03803 family)